MPGTESSESNSFDAFAKVDELVSKPVLGSDGAASWQSFRKGVVKSFRRSDGQPSVAPKAPLKKSDRVVFTSWEEERQHEQQVRKDAGHVEAGLGYTAFKKKNSNEEAVERKRRALVEKRIRPDDQEYFIPTKAFEGWKFDYIFTTRIDRGGTGYYWDGHDSIKKLMGELKEKPKEASKDTANLKHENGDPTIAKAKSKKRKKEKRPVFVSDPNNPLEQVQALWQSRNLAYGVASSVDLPDGWEAAKDATTGLLYYYHRDSGQRSWEKPIEAPSGSTVQVGEQQQEVLLEGWKSAFDVESGRQYYYHTNGETQWEKPTTR